MGVSALTQTRPLNSVCVHKPPYLDSILLVRICRHHHALPKMEIMSRRHAYCGYATFGIRNCRYRFAAAPCQTASKESGAAAKRSRALHSRPIALQSWLAGPRGPRGPRGIAYYLGMALEDLYGLAVERSRHVSPEDEKRLRDRYINYGSSPSAVQSLHLRIQLTFSLHN